MILVNSFVVALPSQPVRERGTDPGPLSHAGRTPVQLTLFSVDVLLAALVVSTTKHLNLLIPSAANFGSLSCSVVMWLPAVRPVPVILPTGKMFVSAVSM